MNGKFAMNNINQIKLEIDKSKILKGNKKKKYSMQLSNLYIKYEKVDIDDKFKSQYNQLNSKGVDLIKDIKSMRDKNKLEGNIEIYIRYLKASLCDFEGKTNYLRKYITSFLFSSILFLALSPQFYGFILPVLFFLPIYMGLKGVKQRTVTGFYMTMSVVPVSIMTSFTWIRYGINAKVDYLGAVKSIVNSGVSESLAEKLVYIGPIFGVVLLLFACLQMYRGYKSKDLFI